MSGSAREAPFGAIVPASLVAAPARVLRDLGLYGASSAAALALDWGTLTALVRCGVPPLVAGAAGFALGMVVTYLASIHLVFADRRGGAPAREAAVFVVIGLAGLGLNEVLLLAFGAMLGLSAPVAKAPTAGLVFLFNFTLRRAMLFAKPAS